MGRYVRRILRTLAERPDVALTLISRDPKRDGELIPGAASIALARARRTRFDAAWYPWNAVRFPIAAPSVVTINDDFAFRYPARGLVARSREQLPIRRAVSRATLLTTISRWSQQTIARRFALEPASIAILPLVPDPYFCPGRAAGEEPDFVLAVGAGDPRKNLTALITAHAIAFPGRDVPLVVVGTLSSDERTLARRSRIRLDERRAVTDDALRELYRSARIVSVPSRAEGFGLVAAEALACGAVVLGAANSAIRETVADAGMLVDPADVEAWAIALRELWYDPHMRATYEARALTRWNGANPDAAANALLTLLAHLVDNRA